MNKLTENEKRVEELEKRYSEFIKRVKPLMISIEDIEKRFRYQSEEGIEKILKSLMKKADLDFIYKMFPEHKIIEIKDRTVGRWHGSDKNFYTHYGYPVLRKDEMAINSTEVALNALNLNDLAMIEKIIEELETRYDFSAADLILKHQNSRKKNIYITVSIDCNSTLYTHKKDSKGGPGSTSSLGKIVVFPPHSEDSGEWRYPERIEKIGFKRVYNLNGVLHDETELAWIPSRTKGYHAEAKEHGIWNRYYENGTCHWAKYMVEGFSQGRQQFFYENGNIEKENYLNNNDLDGREVTYYENGNIRSERYYIITKGRPHLPEHVKLRHDWSLEPHEFHLKKSHSSVRHGKEKIYYENGQLEIEGEFDRGCEIGIWIYYNEDGTIKKKVDGYEVMKKKNEELWDILPPRGEDYA